MTAQHVPGRPAGADVAAISDWVRKIHGPDPVDTYEDGTQACIACHEPHPCIETLLADAYDNVRAERDDILNVANAERVALRARVERAEQRADADRKALRRFEITAVEEVERLRAALVTSSARAERAEAALRLVWTHEEECAFATAVVELPIERRQEVGLDQCDCLWGEARRVLALAAPTEPEGGA